MVIHIRLPEILVTTVFAGLLLITLSASAFAANPFRVQVGVGVQGGDPEVEFVGDLDTDTGIAISAGVWVDKVKVEISVIRLGIFAASGFRLQRIGVGCVLGRHPFGHP